MTDVQQLAQGIEHSATLTELGQALAKAQAGFSHPSKSRTVDVGNYRYSYAELPAVLDAVRPALATNGLSVLQPVEVRGTHVRVWTMLLHTSGEWLRTALVLQADSPKPQAIGSAITYGRRYGLSAMLGIAADEDEDGALASSAPAPVAAKPKPAPVAAKPAPVPNVTVGGGTAFVTDILAKDSKTGKKFYTITFDDGRKGSTFDAKLADNAQLAHSEGWAVRRVLTPSTRDARYSDLTLLEPIEPVEDVPDVDDQVGDDDIPF